MGLGMTLVLGFVAGATILLGLPIGRLKRPAPTLRVLLNAIAVGLAIGQSAATGQIALATLLVIGFALHNATEGFGITAPLAGDTGADGTPRRPSWPFLLGLGLIGGGPTFLGTLIGHRFTSEP